MTIAPPLPPGFLDRPIAHRALHGPGRAENSLAAIRAAAEAGYGIEVDVQLSADGVAMVFHDYDLDRLTAGTGAVHDRTAGELGAIPLRGGGGPIPTLAEALEAAAGAPLLIEVKDQSGDMSEAGIGPLERAVAAALTGHAGPVALMSFNPHAAAALAAAVPDVPRGLVTCAWDPDHWPNVPEATRAALRHPDLAALGAAFASHDRRDLASAQVARMKAEGAAILTWTIRSPDEAEAALAHADQITFEGYRP